MSDKLTGKFKKAFETEPDEEKSVGKSVGKGMHGNKKYWQNRKKYREFEKLMKDDDDGQKST